MKQSQKSIDLGKLQEQFEEDRKGLKAAERQLERAQAERDSKAAQAQRSEAELKAASRAVLG